MEYIIIYVASILVSLGMDIDFALQFVKDIADSGGKINIDRINDVYSYIPEFDKKVSKIARFIPIINVCYSICTRLIYEAKRNDMLYQLNVLGVIDEMTEEEKDEYNKKPTRLHALDVMANISKEKNIEPKELSIVEKMENAPIDDEDLPENKIVLTVGDDAYTVKGDSLDEQFDNVLLAIDVYEELLSSKEYSETDGIKELSEEDKKLKLIELKKAKLELLKVRKQIKKQEKKLKKTKK